MNIQENAEEETSSSGMKISDISRNTIPFFSLKGYKTEAKALSVFDGNTAMVAIPWVNPNGSIGFYKVRVRLQGIFTVPCRINNNRRHMESKNESVKNYHNTERMETAYKARKKLVDMLTDLTVDDNDYSDFGTIQTMIDNQNSKIVYVHFVGQDKTGRERVMIYKEHKDMLNENRKASFNERLIDLGFVSRYVPHQSNGPNRYQRDRKQNETNDDEGSFPNSG